ncbi:MAG: enoyl-CoA hydratase/isomerase family protein [Chromatiales bacterium]|nr:enoyl-CoA hydratase/isomerase family protein [Chromatiales bacterium]
MSLNASDTTYRNWHLEEDADGIVWLRIETADQPTNVLTAETLTEFEVILGQLAAAPPRGLVIGSARDNGFIAGADVKAFTRIATEEEALALIQRGQAVMDAVAALPCPTVALINGYCLGGGLELALACDYRIALDDPRTRLALPEVKLGIHPGFGGSARAIRLLGVLRAMDLMLSGRSIDAKSARRMGLVDYVVPERQLQRAAHDTVLARPAPARRPWLQGVLDRRPLRPLVARLLRRQVAAKAPHAHYPAPYALIDIWEQHGDSSARLFREEALSVARLITGDTARNLIRVFQLQTQLKGLGDRKAFTPRHVHVIGAGVMGGDIAIWCALQGLRVTVQDPRPEALAQTIKRAQKQFARRFRSYPLLGMAAGDRLIPDPQGHGLGRADVVIEAIFEDLQAKRALYRDIEPRMRAEALLATNTSSIPLERLAEGLADASRLVGLHFFNPVAKMSLLEIVRGETTSEATMARAQAFARHIDKLPLPVKSSPGFLVNRVLMPYLLEAVILYEEGVPREIIDRAARDFGMPMGPIELADTVGLDICQHVGEILAGELGYEVPKALSRMVERGHLGSKSGQGFYDYKQGRRVKTKPPEFTGSLEEIQDRLILRYLNEAVACLREGVVEDADLIDAGMIFGTGFAPFRGGPMHYRAQYAAALEKRLRELAETQGPRFAPDAGWQG